MGKRVVIRDLDSKLVRHLAVQLAEQVFIQLVAAAENRENHWQPGQIDGDLRDEIKALLRHEARDDYHPPRAGFGDSKFLQQIALTLLFAVKVLARVRLRDEFVFFRRPLVVIHAIEDAGQRAGAAAQHAFESKTVFAGLDLLCVFFADRSEVVGKYESAFQEIHLAPKLELVDSEQVPGQHEQWQGVRRKQSLVAKIVDCKHSGSVHKNRIVHVTRLQENGHERRLPVMAVKNFRHAKNL